jgi:hypothetical protein
MKKKTTLLGLFCAVVLSAFAAQEIYVSPTGSDENTGTSGSPYATIAKAVSMVSEDGAVIYVASGTYVFGSTAIIKPYNQTIVGDDAATTIFDGNNAVALIDGQTEMQGSQKTLTLQKVAFKNAKMDVTAETGGSAVRMGAKTNLNVESCYFYKNLSESTSGIIAWGGAIYFCGNNLNVDKCFFEENSSKSSATEGYGGAIAVRHLWNTGGTTHEVLGATYAVIKNSTFYKNFCKSKGGAVYFNKQLNANLDDEDATFVVQNCVFLENKGGNGLQLGAAVALSSGTNSTNNKVQSIILTNNTMCNNAIVNSAGDPTHKNTVLLEGFRYTSYMANNLITSSLSANGEALFANQPAPIEYGRNNIIDKIGANINGADFTTNAVAMNNVVVAVTPEELKLSTTLSGYPVGTSFAVPYLTVTSGSVAINGGVNSYQINTIANPAPAAAVEYVLSTDMLGFGIQQGVRDLGAFEFSPSTANATELIGKNGFVNENGGVRVSKLNSTDRIMVYNTNGILVYQTVVRDTETFIPLTGSGIYVISINGKAQKHYFQ